MLVGAMGFVKTESNSIFPINYLNLSARAAISRGNTEQSLHFTKCECHLHHFKEPRCEINKGLQEWFL